MYYAGTYYRLSTRSIPAHYAGDYVYTDAEFMENGRMVRLYTVSSTIYGELHFANVS